MKKRPLIYVRRITNLSDGRYCAGMGVDMLGFVVNPGHEDYVSAQQYQEMSGWIAGPKRVAEFTSPEDVDVNAIVRAYAPDLLHIPIKSTLQKNLPSLPVVVEATLSDWRTAGSKLSKSGLDIRHVLITEINGDDVELPPGSDFSLLLSVDNPVANLSTLLSASSAAGLCLQGTRELTPGLKDYDSLSRVLEEFEE